METLKEYRAYYDTNYDKLTAYESIVKVIGDDEVKAWRKENAGIDLVKLDKAMLKDYPLLGHIWYWGATRSLNTSSTTSTLSTNQSCRFLCAPA